MNNASNVSSISNSIKTMPVITHNGVPVVTTETIASLYDTVVGNIKTNFSRNTKRFIEGKHYFKLTGSILRELKRKVTQSNSVKIARNVNALILWTERGAARHAKMLDTDNAWDVFEALEDFYFAKKEDAQQKINLRQSTAKELTPLRQTAERLIATGVGNIYPDIWKYVHKEFGVDHINELLPEQIPQAISYLDALEGEYIPKSNEQFVSCRVLQHYNEHGVIIKSEVAIADQQLISPSGFTEIAERRGYVMVKKDSAGAKFNKHKITHTLEGAVIHIRAMKEYWNNGLKDSLKQLGYQHTGSMTEHMTDILFHLDWAIHEIKGDNLEKLPA